MEYSLDQIDLFYKSILEIENYDRAIRLQDIALATSAGFNGGKAAEALNELVQKLME
jgi:hypothetical protein